MTSGISFEQGEIVLIPFPFTNLKAVKKRPVLVVSSTEYNRKADDFVVCGITSNLKDSDYSVLIDKPDLAKGFIPVASRIKADKIFTLEKSLALKKIGKVKDEVLAKTKKAIRNVIDD